ncbi:glycosyltransferase family 2 protein [Shimia sp. SDUM112013]|uniref:glycosyltransferase family 2 protein n=1 Tax=Shimia sp. SDUM112013 TaxID=3136160 RepID=UPI0032EB3F16
MRDEGPYLLEWIAHHRAAGMTDFLVYSNDCADGTDDMLDKLQDAGVLTHVRHEKPARKSIQWQALRSAWKHPMRKASDWVLVSDVDEFVNIHVPGHTFADLLASIPGDTDVVILPWRLFGHNNELDIKDRPVTEQFTRAIPPDTAYPVSAGFFKTLFRTKGPFNQLGVHRPQQKTAALPRFVDGSGAALPEGFAANPKRLSLFMISQGRAKVELNHYSIRSAAGFLVKSARGLPNRSHKNVDLAYWVERNFNTVEDQTIAAMRPATRQILLELLQIDGVAKLHKQAVAWHQNRFRELIREEPYHRLLTQILTASGSEVLPLELQQQLVRWYQDIK